MGVAQAEKKMHELITNAERKIAVIVANLEIEAGELISALGINREREVFIEMNNEEIISATPSEAPEVLESIPPPSQPQPPDPPQKA